MLVKIEACQTTEQARIIYENTLGRNADDILCSLWYLIPNTQAALSDSIRDEYHRLGSVNEYISSFAQSTFEYSEEAKLAYEFVAVVSKLKIGLPVEVLVRALGISYEDFLSMSDPDKPLWGLLYNVSDEEGDTILFRTRNDIVTRVLLKLVNGGVGHAGEFRILKRLIEACANGGEIYRNFIIEILVDNRSELEKYFSYQQGVELYKSAISTMGNEDRLLEHNFGIWHKNFGFYELSYLQLEATLLKSPHPNAKSDRECPEDHVHTTMAASVVGLVREGKQSITTGFDLVMGHLDQASRANYLNPHSGHVRANILFEIALQNVSENPDIRTASFALALHETEKHLQSIGPLYKKSTKYEKSVFLLKDLQRKLSEKIDDNVILKEQAFESFGSKRSQIGFELYLRKILLNAQQSNKGSDYNFVREEIIEIVETVKKGNETVSVHIHLIYIDLIVRWRLQGTTGEVDWGLLKDTIINVLSNDRFRDDPLVNFYLSIAYYHVGDYERSNSIFASLRRMQLYGLQPHEIRCYYLGKEGHPKRFQCTINRSYGNLYVSISELKQDIKLSRAYDRQSNHVYIGFSLNGLVAQFDKPDTSRLLLG